MTLVTRIHDSGYEALLSMLLANFLAQLWKFLQHRRRHGSFNFPTLFSTGGMPSSHSSTVTALATSVGLVAGWDAPVFIVTVCYAFITMFDAAGLRQSASRQAQALNEIVHELLSPEHRLNRSKLKELLGHTPREVLSGAALGVAVALAMRVVLRALG